MSYLDPSMSAAAAEQLDFSESLDSEPSVKRTKLMTDSEKELELISRDYDRASRNWDENWDEDARIMDFDEHPLFPDPPTPRRSPGTGSFTSYSDSELGDRSSSEGDESEGLDSELGDRRSGEEDESEGEEE